MTDRARTGDELVAPDVMFLPFAVLGEDRWRAGRGPKRGSRDGAAGDDGAKPVPRQDLMGGGSVDDGAAANGAGEDAAALLRPGLAARRVPDFVHQLLNQGEPGPTAMLELQTDVEDGPVRWMRFDQVPDRDDVFALMPMGLDVRAVVAGEIEPVDGGLRVEFHVFRSDPSDDAFGDSESVSEKIGAVLRFDDPVATLVRLTRHLARALDLPYVTPPHGLLTRSAAAFFLFLQGLDNAMLLSGDLDIAVPVDREPLLRPFADALALDPHFGLALRLATATAAVAYDGRRLERDAVRRFLDRCYAAQPADGDACVAVADQLTAMGDEDRARSWLEHAARLDPPSPRGLESLGILRARNQDIAGARALWRRGLEVDGHPDFYSHLAQLSFAEGERAEAWRLVERGLWRLRERTARAAEWNDQERGQSALLECLSAAITARPASGEPVGEGVAAALATLTGLFSGEDAVNLGLCLAATRATDAARRELTRGLRAPTLDLESRDRAVRALLKLAVTDFEKHFAKAVDVAVRSRDPRPSLEQFASWYELQDEFWPALFFGGVARRRLGDTGGALDLFAEALELSPGQPDVLFEMAELFAGRQNCKRALELVDQALLERPRLPKLHEARLRCLRDLGRMDEARAWHDRCLALGVESPELQKLGHALKKRP